MMVLSNKYMLTFFDAIQNLQKLANKSSSYQRTAYNAVIRKMENTPKKKITARALDALDLTEHMKEKILAFKPITIQLTSIPGIGPKKAAELHKMGVRTISDLKKKSIFATLPEIAKTALIHSPERHIPHAKIRNMAPTLTHFPGAIIVGSYRRKVPYSRDIDVMIVSDDEDILQKYIQYLGRHFATHVYSAGKDRVSLLIDKYKLDAFRCQEEDKYPMLLYSTGSKTFNIRMRAIAKKKGYLLNQYGLYKGTRRIPVSSERDIFNLLDMPYTPPEKR